MKVQFEAHHNSRNSPARHVSYSLTILTGQTDQPSSISFHFPGPTSSASGPSSAGGDEPEAAGAWKSEKRNKRSSGSSPLRRRGRENFPLAEHGGLRWAPAAASRPGGVAPRASIRAAAVACGFPFDAVRVPGG